MKKIISGAFFLSLAGFLFCAQVFAQVEGNPENWCRNGFFPSESSDFRIARVKGGKGDKIYFHDDAADCPGAQKCRLKSYVIPGDEIIVSREFGNFGCAWYQPPKGGETVGWIALENLTFVETPLISQTSDWLGEWKFYDNAIRIAASKTPGILSVTGDALWRGQGDNVHVGELDHEARPQKNLLQIGSDEDDCRVSMWRVGAFLIASDNLRCGGLNVSFSGVYRRKAAR